MTRLGIAFASAAALALSGCAAGVEVDGDAAVADTEVRGTFVPANDFVAVARTSRPTVVHGDARGYWTYGSGNTMYFVSDGSRARGRWYVQGDRYCTTYRGIPDRCYRVYRTADNRYALYDDDNRIWARISF